MINLDRITVDPGHMNGQPCMRGTRLTVRRIIEICALYPDPVERYREFPEIDEEDCRQALHYAAMNLPDQITTLPENELVA